MADTDGTNRDFTDFLNNLNEQSTSASKSEPEGAVGRDDLGQPIGLANKNSFQNELMPKAVSGQDESQIVSTEKLRASGGYSATDILLGLNHPPPALGILHAPPGNSEALRHLTPAMRRTILRNLLSKQREKLRQLSGLLRSESQNSKQSNKPESEEPERIQELFDPADFNNRRDLKDLKATIRMLDLLEKLLKMQDYAANRMGNSPRE